MKPYIVLAGDTYYPRGWPDYQGEFDTLVEAKAFADGYVKAELTRWAHVVNLETKECEYVA